MIFKPSPLSRMTIDDQVLVQDKNPAERLAPVVSAKKHCISIASLSTGNIMSRFLLFSAFLSALL